TTSPLNTVPLVAQRSTAVRAMLGNTGDGYVAGVTGTLSVFVDGTPISIGSNSASINPSFVAPAYPAWANECDPLNFEIPAPSGITASSNVKFVVDVAPVDKEKDTTNNSSEVTLPFANRTTPLLYYTRINFADQGLPDPALVKAGPGDSFVRGIYPVNDADATLYRQGLFPTLTWADPNGNGILDSGTEVSNLLSFLAQCRALIVNSGVGPDDRVFLYGWIKDNPIDGNGWAEVGCRV